MKSGQEIIDRAAPGGVLHREPLETRHTLERRAGTHLPGISALAGSPRQVLPAVWPDEFAAAELPGAADGGWTGPSQDCYFVTAAG